jgi:hypothetical protein
MLTQLQVGEFLRTLRNPRYANENHEGAIALDGTYNGQTLVFFASPTDAMDYGRNIYQRAIDGDFGPIKDFEPIVTNNIPPPVKHQHQPDLFAEKK